LTNTLHIDFETRSDVDIQTRGAYLYFGSPHTAPLMASYKLGAALRRWLPHEPCPPDVAAHVAAGGTVTAHNANFERQLWQRILTPKYGWPAIRTEQFRCTLATASALGLPRRLDRLGDALNLKVKKDREGADLIRFFSIPREIRGGVPVFNEPKDFPLKFERFRDYCDADVESEAEADARMIPLSDDEQAVWVLDQTINDRGVRIDTQSAASAIRLIEKATLRLNAEMREATGGAVSRATEVAKLAAWCNSRGVALEGVGKSVILEALEQTDLPKDVERALLIRQEAGKASTTKLRTFLRRCDADGRVRGAFVYHGAAPGRWSSTGVNLANLPRPRKEYEDADIDLETLFHAFREEDPDYLAALYGAEVGRPLHLVSDALRSFLWAAPGHELIAVDYSGIQGALTAWLAGEEWKLQAMRDLIADPKLPDLYRRAAAAMLGVSTDVVTKKHWARQIGKVAELSLGFQGSVAAFLGMAKNYALDLDSIAEPVWRAAVPEDRAKVERRYARCLVARDKVKTDLLSREVWLACDLVKTGWRRTNPKIVELWADLEDAMRMAVWNPGKPQKVSKVSYLVARGFLWCRLPSGRCMAYASPRLKDQVWARLKLDDGSWSEAETMDREEAERLEIVGRAKIDGPTKAKITALGVDSQTQKLHRYAVYGGLCCENLAMGCERDILVNGMRAIEKVNYSIVAHNYDEIVAEVPRGWGSVDEMVRLMCDLPACYAGLPLTATGFRGKRFKKG
jgi:DNA polymerase bacteriophage-type